LTRLIDDLLDVSRISRNKLDLRLQRIELQEVVRSAIEICRPLVDQNGHDVLLSMAAEPIYLRGDLARDAEDISVTNAQRNPVRRIARTCLPPAAVDRPELGTRACRRPSRPPSSAPSIARSHRGRRTRFFPSRNDDAIGERLDLGQTV
jgi:hypothetical protein